jgi:hypothetical protein
MTHQVDAGIFQLADAVWQRRRKPGDPLKANRPLVEDGKRLDYHCARPDRRFANTSPAQLRNPLGRRL